MLHEPLASPEAKKLIRRILGAGFVTYAQPHAVMRLQERGISTLDCVNVLRGGVVAPAEFENNSWRYRVYTAKLCVVIRFESEEILEVVTAWRES